MFGPGQAGRRPFAHRLPVVDVRRSRFVRFFWLAGADGRGRGRLSIERKIGTAANTGRQIPMEDKHAFRAELEQYLANRGHRQSLEMWHLIEARYPESLAGWLTEHPEFRPPDEKGVRIGKRLDHMQGGRANL